MAVLSRLGYETICAAHARVWRRSPAILEVFTEDCFAGRVRGEDDLVSQVCEFPYLNPQAGGA